MNSINRLMVVGFFILFIGVGNSAVFAAGNETATTELINTTVMHLDAALKSLDANNLAAAQQHLKAAGQSSKLILGGRVEARKQGGSRAITTARQQLEKGDTVGASDALKEALEGFKSLLLPDKTGNQGGL